MVTISELFIKVGTSFSTLFTSDIAVYALYFIAFLFGLFSLYRVLLQKVPHLQGKPANVIAFMITVISTGSIFYGKSPAQLISLFNGFTGTIVITLLSIGLMGLGFMFSKEKSNILKTMILSFFTWVSSAILLGPLKNYLIVLNNQNLVAKDVVKVLVEILDPVSMIALLVFIVSSLIFLFSLLGGEGSVFTSKPKTAEQKNRSEMKRILKNIQKESNEANNRMTLLGQNLTKIVNAAKGSEKPGITNDYATGIWNKGGKK